MHTVISGARLALAIRNNPRTIARKVRTLYSRWFAITRTELCLATALEHSTYLEIVAIGWPAVPAILVLLQAGHVELCRAISEITGLGVPAGNLDAQARAWLCWAERNGYAAQLATN